MSKASINTLSLGYSPCPNDTYIFHALVSARVRCEGYAFAERLEDVETLNMMAMRAVLDVTKISFGAAPAVMDDYCVLRSGGALGRGCGPLLVAREKVGIEELAGARMAVPGFNTTAFLLLRLMEPALAKDAVAMPFDRIMPAVAEGRADAGLIIHESRFTYPAHGLVEIEDLGRWWEARTGKPIPLGCIVARRSLGSDALRLVETAIRDSVLYARTHPREADAYIRSHSQELSDDVIQHHIALYVNDFSVDMGREGEDAIRALFDMAAGRGLIKGPGLPLFAD